MALVGRRRVFVILVFTATLMILLLNSHLIPETSVSSNIKGIFTSFKKHAVEIDKHPIRKLMKAADQLWTEQEDGRSTNLRQTVNKYRQKYGRHPPPGFTDWYKFARDKNVHNIDDFQQIMDDLRPFWGVEPAVIRSLAANMPRVATDRLSGIHIRGGKVSQSNPGWRSKALASLIQKFAEHLPDMDIAMNRLDQPRVVVPWEDLQTLLAKEEGSRHLPPDAVSDWTNDMQGLFVDNVTTEYLGNLTIEDPGWFDYSGNQYMDLAKDACPPESHARDPDSTTFAAESLYKDSQGGLITNFNLSTDLCTVGPELQRQHGFLYSASSIIASKRLVPVFGECKVSVNNDILFPANMYWKHDERYDYDGKYDWDWEDKNDTMIWRGVSSGGTQVADNWQTMHRQRLVMMVNGTLMKLKDEEVRILKVSPKMNGEYENYPHFRPSIFADNHTDVGFVETWGCIPNCSFYKDVWTLKPQTSLAEQFKYKYVVDVDGHSFSGRWHAFLQSKSLGIKSTIFREWHDSRLIAWRHFVPMDNRYDDIYTLLTYFIGLGNQAAANPNIKDQPLVMAHDFEGAKIAKQSRAWASKVLRRDDIEIYMYRLLIEYARIIDDNRDRIGYAGDGSEMEEYDRSNPMVGDEGRW